MSRAIGFLKEYRNLFIIFFIALSGALPYYKKEISSTEWLLITLFGSITTVSFYRALERMVTVNESPGIQQSSPSIDGSISGWRLTPTLALLLISCFFASVTLLVAMHATGLKHTTGKAIENTTQPGSKPTIKDSSSGIADSAGMVKFHFN